MKKIERSLEERMRKLTRPEPTIKIFNGHQYYITENGERGNRKQVSVQLSVAFRKKQLRQLKGPILAVFLCIALHINEKGQAWPSISLIAKETGYSRDTVFKRLKGLEKMGFISRVQKQDEETGKFRSNVYQLFPNSRRYKAKDRV
jgi:DNA-binding MarR family transcriptional regulator